MSCRGTIHVSIKGLQFAVRLRWRNGRRLQRTKGRWDDGLRTAERTRSTYRMQERLLRRGCSRTGSQSLVAKRSRDRIQSQCFHLSKRSAVAVGLRPGRRRAAKSLNLYLVWRIQVRLRWWRLLVPGLLFLVPWLPELLLLRLLLPPPELL